MALDYDRLDKVYEVLTERISDTNAPSGLDLGSALGRVLAILRRIERRLVASAERETRLLTAVEALAATSGANEADILAAVNAALEAIEDLDDDYPPTLTSISPATGAEAGGTPVTVVGTGFVGATGLMIGDAMSTDFAVVSDEAITATTPAGVGVVDVMVHHTEGNATLAGAFTYVP